ncbi:MAG: hypothetical protein ACOYLB_03520 [Phototrophicaceae bacterium]
MSNPPDYQQTRALLSYLNVVKGNPFDALHPMLNTLFEWIPNALGVRIVLYSAEKQPVPDPAFSVGEGFAATFHVPANLSSSQPYTVEHEGAWHYGFAIEPHLGLLELITAQSLSSAWVQWINQLPPILTFLCAPPQLSSRTAFSPDLIRMSHDLSVAVSYDDIVHITLESLPSGVNGVILTLFSEPVQASTRRDALDGAYRSVVAIATEDVKLVLEPNESTSVLPLEANLARLLLGMPLVIRNVHNDIGYISGGIRQLVEDLKVVDLVALGLQVDGELFGTVDLLISDEALLHQVEAGLDWLAPFMSQITLAIRNQMMFKRSLRATEFAERLVSVNRKLAQAVTYHDMARTIMGELPGYTQSLSIALFNRSFTLMGAPSALTTQIILGANTAREAKIKDVINAKDDARVTYFLQQFLQGQVMLMWMVDRPGTPVLATELISHLLDDEPNYIFAIGLNVNQSLRGLMVIGTEENIRLDAEAMAILRPVADQLAAVIESRLQFSQIEKQLALSKAQFDITYRMSTSKDAVDLLAALNNFWTGRYDFANFMIADQDQHLHILARMQNGATFGVYETVQSYQLPSFELLRKFPILEVRDVTTDFRLSLEDKEYFLNRGILSVLLISNLGTTQLDTIVVFESIKAQEVSEDELKSFSGLVNQASIIYHNQELLRRSLESSSFNQVLFALNQVAFQSDSSLSILESIFTYSVPQPHECYLVEIQVGLDDHFKQMVLRYQVSETGNFILEKHITEPMSLYEAEFHLILGDKTDSVYAGDPSRDIPNFYGLLQYAGQSTGVVAIPLKLNDTTFNLLLFLYRKPYPMNYTRRKSWQTIVELVEIAIQNIHIRTQTQRNMRNRVLLNEVGATLQNQIHLDQLVDVTVNQLARTLGAKKVRFRLRTESDSSPDSGG